MQLRFQVSVLLARSLLLKRDSLRFAQCPFSHLSSAYLMKHLFLITGREGQRRAMKKPQTYHVFLNKAASSLLLSLVWLQSLLLAENV